ncbi:kinase-like domain-containing protein [Multifurca ochricompacta]|uniref:non-specific serine/threonine protein kinase n=1 Tax=Multifurca ochricompacta TaxID=376703 RepID=A0AAD4LZV8_9AGAM|nr:kinase-like domain-containing protein [Multifurca ochricompacta]
MKKWHSRLGLGLSRLWFFFLARDGQDDEVGSGERCHSMPPLPHLLFSSPLTALQIVLIQNPSPSLSSQPLHASSSAAGPQNPILYDGKQQYRIEGLLGAGAFGRVALATVIGKGNSVSSSSSSSSLQQVAIKVYSNAHLVAMPSLLGMYETEKKILAENALRRSQWLVQLRGAFEDVWNRYLVMDYYPNTLASVIFSHEYGLPKSIVRLWIEELTLAMYELYYRRIVHCDLKPGNILVTLDGHLAIADFGIALMPESDSESDSDSDFDPESKSKSKSKSWLAVSGVAGAEWKPNRSLGECEFYAYGGTYAYQAPELLITHGKALFTCAADMWSLGVIIYEIYTRKRLFSAEANGVRNEVWGWDIPSIVRADIDNELVQDLLIKLLEVEVNDRLKVKELTWHSYFEETNWASVEKKVGLDQVKFPKPAELRSFSWEDALKFERPMTLP